MGLTDEVRRSCRAIAEGARFVSIDLERLGEVEPSAPPELDPERHFLEGTPDDVAAYMLTLDAINFGSGWFPTLRKRPGCSGYFTVAWALADFYRAGERWSNADLRRLSRRGRRCRARAGSAVTSSWGSTRPLCAPSGSSWEGGAHCSW